MSMEQIVKIVSPRHENKYIYLWPKVGYWVVSDADFPNQFNSWLQIPNPNFNESDSFIHIAQDLFMRKALNENEVHPSIFSSFQFDTGIEELEFTKTGLVVGLTERCNLTCAYCYAESTPKKGEMISKELFEERVMNCSKYHFRDNPTFSRKISLVGGEPFLHPQLFEFVEIAYKWGYAPSITTNGTVNISTENLKTLSKLKCELNFSVDGPNDSIHSLTRKSKFKKIFKQIQKAIEIGISTQVSCFVHSGNFEYLEQYLNEFLLLGISGVNFNTLNQIGRGLTAEGISSVKNDELFKKLTELCQKNKNYISVLKGNSYYSILFTVANCISKIDCGVGQEAFYLDTDGSLYICGALKFNKFKVQGDDGNIDSNKVDKIIDSLQIEKIEDCHDCDFAYFCAGDCRGEVLARKLALEAKHPNCESIKSYLTEMMFDLSDGLNVL